MALPEKIINRRDAKDSGLTRYFTGDPCRSGHVSERQVAGGNCTECAKLSRERFLSTEAGKAMQLATKRRFRESNSEKIKAQAAGYRKKNPEHRAFKNRQWHEKMKSDPIHLEKKRENSRAWNKRNPIKSRESASTKRAIKRSARPHDFGELDRLVMSEAARIAHERQIKTGIKWHIDHMIPLSKGGFHRYDNIQVIPAWLNLWKRNRMILTMPMEWTAHCV